MNTNQIVDVTMQEEKRVRMAEHEILLSFNNDDDAEKFADWWRGDGLYIFSGWVDGVAKRSAARKAKRAGWHKGSEDAADRARFEEMR